MNKKIPIQVHLQVPITFVSCGDFHSLFLTKNGQVYGCGSNENFQLEQPESIHYLSPVLIPEKDTILQISAGFGSSLLLNHSNELIHLNSKRIIFKPTEKVRVIESGQSHYAFISGNKRRAKTSSSNIV